MAAERVRTARARGCLLGAACGDALGAPFEGTVHVDPAAVAAWADSAEPLRYTDDTTMLLTLAEHLAEVGDIDEAELIHRFALAWQAEPWRGYGAGPPAIFRQVLMGRSWEEAARAVFPGGSFGNGAAMRVAPVGLVDGSLERVAALARSSARVTHRHPLGLDGAVAQAVAVALAARSPLGEPLDVEGFLAAVDRHLRTADFRQRLSLLADLVSSAAGPAEVAERVGNDVRAVTSVPAALSAFLGEPDDVPGALRFAVAIGGDADTIAAMTGALAGARNGASALPASWLARLEHRAQLVAAADRLVR